MKKLLIVALLLLSIFLIYLNTVDKKVYYLSLGDSLAEGKDAYGGINYGYADYIKDYLDKKKVLENYINDFSVSGYRSIDLYHDIEENKKLLVNGKEVRIKNALIKADLLTLSIGANDILSKLTLHSNSTEIYGYIDEIMLDVESLLKLIREYCKEDIVMINYYNPLKLQELDQYIEYANNRLKELTTSYDVVYVDIYRIFKQNKDYLPNPIDIHPSKLGYQAISKAMIASIDDVLFKK